LRPGEISGLNWPAVDLGAGKVIVHQSLAWVSYQPVLKEPKTGRTRTLDLPPRTSKLCNVTGRLRWGSGC
jgi:integrase